MPWWTWVTLGFFAVVVLVGAVTVLVALLGLRRLEETGSRVETALADLTRKSEELETRLDEANERAELVARKLAQLEASMERLSVLTWALGDVSKTIAHVRDAVTLRK